MPAVSRKLGNAFSRWAPGASPRSIQLILTLVMLCTVPLSGCGLIGDSEHPTPASRIPAPSPTATALAVGAGEPATAQSSIAVIRPEGAPDRSNGSAVVIRSDGLLVTATDNLDDSFVVELADGRLVSPVLVATDPASRLSLLKVPAERLVPVRFNNKPLATGDTVVANGYDGATEDHGQMGGTLTGTIETPENAEYQPHHPMFLQTDISEVSGFIGGMLTDENGAFAGVLVSHQADDGDQALAAISHWYLLDWLEARRERLNTVISDAVEWPVLELPDNWNLRYPDGWSASISGDAPRVHADITPGDPDAPLEFAVRVEDNALGADAARFIDEHFLDGGSAKLWGVEQHAGYPLVRVVMQQEGALRDIAYLLTEDYLITLSLTSGFPPDSDSVHAERARTIFDAVLNSLRQAPAE